MLRDLITKRSITNTRKYQQTNTNVQSTPKGGLEQNITNRYWITIKHPQIEIMHQSAIIKTVMHACPAYRSSN